MQEGLGIFQHDIVYFSISINTPYEVQMFVGRYIQLLEFILQYWLNYVN